MRQPEHWLWLAPSCMHVCDSDTGWPCCCCVCCCRRRCWCCCCCCFCCSCCCCCCCFCARQCAAAPTSIRRFFAHSMHTVPHQYKAPDEHGWKQGQVRSPASSHHCPTTVPAESVVMLRPPPPPQVNPCNQTGACWMHLAKISGLQVCHRCGASSVPVRSKQWICAACHAADWGDQVCRGTACSLEIARASDARLGLSSTPPSAPESHSATTDSAACATTETPPAETGGCAPSTYCSCNAKEEIEKLAAQVTDPTVAATAAVAGAAAAGAAAAILAAQVTDLNVKVSELQSLVQALLDTTQTPSQASAASGSRPAEAAAGGRAPPVTECGRVSGRAQWWG